jgi:putative hemolysin
VYGGADRMGSELLIIIGLMLANGLFAGAEIAILSIRKTQLTEFVRRRDRRALALKSLRDQPERFLATVQIGITVVGTAAAAFGGAKMALSFIPVCQALGFGSYSDEVAFGTVIAIISVLELVLGELIPKSLALRYSDQYAFFVARPMLSLARIMRPLVWFLTALSNLVLRFFGDRTTFTEARLSKDELQELVVQAAKTGSVDPRASEIASRALGFGEVSVAEVMVPRNRVVAMRRGAPSEEVQRVILEQGHSRMPVYDGNMDNIVGYGLGKRPDCPRGYFAAPVQSAGIDASDRPDARHAATPDADGNRRR